MVAGAEAPTAARPATRPAPASVAMDRSARAVAPRAIRVAPAAMVVVAAVGPCSQQAVRAAQVPWRGPRLTAWRQVLEGAALGAASAAALAGPAVSTVAALVAVVP